MRQLWDRLNPTLRAFLIVALIALVVVVLQLYETLIALSLLLRLAFFLVLALAGFAMWRVWRDEHYLL